MSITNSEQLNSLCTRCHALDLYKYVAPWRYGTHPVIASIALESIQAGCTLCTLVAEFIKDIQVEESVGATDETNMPRSGVSIRDTTADDAVVLIIHHHEEEDWDTGQTWEMISFSISTD